MAEVKCAKIACNVQNCTYWGAGNLCVADEIQVSTGQYSQDMEAGSFESPANSSNSHQTQCVTFKPKK